MKEKKTKSESPLKVNLLQIGIKFGITIALPLLGFIALGFILDKKLGTLPIFIILGVIFATILSTLLLSREITEIMQDIDSQKKK